MQFDDMRQPLTARRMIDLVLCLCVTIPVYRQRWQNLLKTPAPPILVPFFVRHSVPESLCLIYLLSYVPLLRKLRKMKALGLTRVRSALLDQESFSRPPSEGSPSSPLRNYVPENVVASSSQKQISSLSPIGTLTFVWRGPEGVHKGVHEGVHEGCRSQDGLH